MGVRICHITTAHHRYDVRIFKKECISLVKSGYEVYLIVSDHLENETKNGVKIVSTGDMFLSHSDRLFKSLDRIKRIIVDIDADVYHLHDPELLKIVSFIKSRNKKVIFDSHEDYYSRISNTTWIHPYVRPIVQSIYLKYEKSRFRRIDGAIVCYHWTFDRYKNYCKNVKMILNFPILDRFCERNNWESKTTTLCFAGLVSSIWCHHEIIRALGKLENITYMLAGPSEKEYLDELKTIQGWDSVSYLGRIPHEKVYSDVYAISQIGMVLLDYIPECRGTFGNLSNTKLFECLYMGLPIICTDFDLWKEIVENEQCGICVNPHNIEQIVSAITYLLDNPDIARQMGENGRNAVMKKYNWDTEEQKLLAFYDKVLNQNA
jgi:glycosyltransferase involved in cell wall biosynthesis